jgi:hypothetical protein
LYFWRCGHHVNERGKNQTCSITNARLYHSIEKDLLETVSVWKVYTWTLPVVKHTINILGTETTVISQTYHAYESCCIKKYKEITGHIPLTEKKNLKIEMKSQVFMIGQNNQTRKMTTQYPQPNIKEMFNKLNDCHFDKEIPNIPVVWNNRMTTTAGTCRSQNFRVKKIDLCNKLFKTLAYDPAKIENTLIHEMVHAYLIHKFKERGHTPRFQQMMKNITGEDKNHRCHNYNTKGLKRKMAKKIRCECLRCGLIYYKVRMPSSLMKNPNECFYTHRGCGGVITFKALKNKK